MQAIRFVFAEHRDNRLRIWKIALQNISKEVAGTTFGLGWIIIKDIFNIGTLLVFRYLMAGDRNIQGMNFLVYLFTGLIPWFFLNDVINWSTQTFSRNKAIVNNIQFPLTTLPTIDVISVFVKRIFTFVFVVVIILFFGDIRKVNVLLVLYYLTAMFFLSVAYNWVMSAFLAISSDLRQFYSAISRVFFFVLPILWSFERIEMYPQFIKILKLNPMAYPILGFRDAFALGNMPGLWYTLYFWAAVLIMLLTGAIVQYKLRKYYADFI